MSILAASDLYKSYTIDGKPLQVLKGVTLEVNPGEILVIQGPSGAGKSTLLHILGLLDSPTRGEIRIEGKKLRARGNTRLRARYIGFVFQFYNLLSDFNVLENVCLPGLIAGERKGLKKQASDMLDRVGLSHRFLHRPGELSGGEQQRVAIVRALINKPRLLLLDEPTGNLDSENAEKIWGLLVRLKNEEGQTMVIVTHNEEFAKQGDRRLHLVDGRIV